MTGFSLPDSLDSFLDDRLGLFQGKTPDDDWIYGVAQVYKTSTTAVEDAVRSWQRISQTALPATLSRADTSNASRLVRDPYSLVVNALSALGKRIQKNHDAAGRESIRAQCPTHDDRRPSLIVTRDGDRVLLHCFGGCTPQHLSGVRRVQKVIEALGIKPHELFIGPSRPQSKPRVTATYDYRALDGALVGRKVRLAPKAFRWLKYSRNVGVYRLPDLVGARLVFLAEGEKACDLLWSLGLPATCGPAGASRWTQQWSLDIWAAGCRELIVLPDNDGAGIEQAERVAIHTAELDVDDPIMIRILELPRLATKADVGDWLECGNSASSLVALAKSAPPWTQGLRSKRRIDRRRELTRERVRRHRERKRLVRQGICPDIHSVTDPNALLEDVCPDSVTRNAVTPANVLLSTLQVIVREEDDTTSDIG